MRSSKNTGIDGIVLAGFFLILLMAFNALFGQADPPAAAAQLPAPKLETQPVDPNAFVSLYDSYIVTQGQHGYSYGHAAIDLTGGKGSVIHSPISAMVVERYVDWLGNTTLVLENERYQVTLMHGLYSVGVGDWVVLGDPIGTESNQGYTVDFQGRLCAGRNCGYHTHLNVYDFSKGENVNPLDLLDSQK